MAKDIPSKKYKGVYYRELKNGDRSYFLIYRSDGKQKRLAIGKKSEGITEQFCYQQKIQIINSEKFGTETAEILQRKSKKSDPTFAELFEYFMQHSPAKASSKKIMQYLINQVPFKDKRRITVDDLLNWQTELAGKLSLNTVDSKINQVSSVLNFAIDAGQYKYDNPCQKIKRFNPDDNRLRYLSRDEVDRLLDAVRDENKPLLYLFTKLALCTGARVSSLMEIRAEHIKGDKIRLYNVKTSQFYTGYIDEETQQLLADKTGYVLSWYGPEVKPKVNQYQWRMRRIFDKLFNQGITDSRDKVVIHTLRHTVASLMVQNGTPLQVVQKVLNHRTIRSTERYAKMHDDNVKNEINRLWQ